jgi:hypothetical protein
MSVWKRPGQVWNGASGKIGLEDRHVGHGIKESESGLNGGSKRYVSFYFTNFPAQLSHFYLRKGFEVCGMLEDVYVAKKRNKNGEPYGFVRFSNVRDVSKMTKALNAVWFGQFRVRATVAKFDRYDVRMDRSQEKEQPGRPTTIVHSLSTNGNPLPTYQSFPKGGVNGGRTKGGGGSALVPEEGGSKMQVGDIVINLGNRPKRTSDDGRQHGEEPVPTEADMSGAAVIGKKRKTLVRNFRTKAADVQWASQGLVATVMNGEAVPVVQNRIADAGFNDVVITPMGADKVFVRSVGGGE